MNENHTKSSKSFTVLIVEDDPLPIAIYKNALSGLHAVRMVHATDGFKGLVEICQHTPEIIITDLDMPNFDGFKMINILQRDHVCRNVPLVVISGLKQADIEKNGGLPPNILLIRKQDFAAANLRLIAQQLMDSTRTQGKG